MGLELQLADELAPGCDMAQLFALLGEHRGAERVMVVGHEPDFSELIGALTGGSQVLMKKGGLGRVDIERAGAGRRHADLAAAAAGYCVMADAD